MGQVRTRGNFYTKTLLHCTEVHFYTKGHFLQQSIIKKNIIKIKEEKNLLTEGNG